jgi:hypothetical protein
MATFIVGATNARRRRAAMHAASFNSREARKARLSEATATITGSAHNGGTLTVGFVGTADSKVYQWFRDGAVVAGQTATTYSVGAGDVGHTIQCRVGFTNAAGYNEYIFSNGLAVS